MVKAAAWLSRLELPVRLIALPEGALQGFNDEVLDLDQVQHARECAIDIPGPETDELGVIARQYNAFVMGQAKAHHPDRKDRFFNVGFILDRSNARARDLEKVLVRMKPDRAGAQVPVKTRFTSPCTAVPTKNSGLVDVQN
jgi:hypothetical protein